MSQFIRQVSLSAMVMSGCAVDPPPPPTPPHEEGLALPETWEPDDHGAGVPPALEEPEEPEEPPEEPPEPEEPPPDCPEVRVVDTGGTTLNIRPDPSTASTPVGALSPGEVVTVLSIEDEGEAVNGNSTWYEIDDGTVSGFVSGAFTACVDPNAPAPTFDDDVFLLPLSCGSRVRVTQGNNTDFSHNGGSKYAFDFGLPLNTPMLAMRSGTVVFVREPTQPGDACYDGGGQSCSDKANTVTIDHGDGTNTLYAHVNSVDVAVGDEVQRGDVVAHSGSTGYSTGPHAHVQRQGDCGIWWCQSIQMRFGDVDEADQIPESGDWVVSQNGCE